MILVHWSAGPEPLPASQVRRVRVRWDSPSIRHLVSRSFGYRFKNLQIPGAAAKVSRKPFANFVKRRLRNFFQEMHRGQNHARSADSALCCTTLEEGLLQGM